jgi:hypothetical protein
MGTKTKLILAMRLRSPEEHFSIHLPKETGINSMDRVGIKAANELAMSFSSPPKYYEDCLHDCDEQFPATMNQHPCTYRNFTQTLLQSYDCQITTRQWNDQLSPVHSNSNFPPPHHMLSHMNHNEQQLCSSAQLPQKSISAVLWFVMSAACAVPKTLSKYVMFIRTSTEGFAGAL